MTIPFGQALLCVPALYGTCVCASHGANLFYTCAGIAGVLNVLGQTAAIFGADHAVSPLL